MSNNRIWVNKLEYTYMAEYYTAIKNNVKIKNVAMGTWCTKCSY